MNNIRTSLKIGRSIFELNNVWDLGVDLASLWAGFRRLMRFASAMFDQRKGKAHSNHAVHAGGGGCSQENRTNPAHASDAKCTITREMEHAALHVSGSLHCRISSRPT